MYVGRVGTIAVLIFCLLQVNYLAAKVTEIPDDTNDADEFLDTLDEPKKKEDNENKLPDVVKNNDNNLDLLANGFELLGPGINDKIDWAKLQDALENLHPRDLARGYSAKTVDLVIELRDQIQQAKDSYENSKTQVLSWCSYSKNPVKFLIAKLPINSDAQNSKLSRFLSNLYSNGMEKFNSASSELKDLQEAMTKAQNYFDEFEAEKKKEDEAAKVQKPKSTRKQTQKNEINADYKEVSVIIKAAIDSLKSVSSQLPSETKIDSSTVNFDEELKDKKAVLKKIESFRDTCSSYESSILQANSKRENTRDD